MLEKSLREVEDVSFIREERGAGLFETMEGRQEAGGRR